MPTWVRQQGPGLPASLAADSSCSARVLLITILACFEEGVWRGDFHCFCPGQPRHPQLLGSNSCCEDAGDTSVASPWPQMGRTLARLDQSHRPLSLSRPHQQLSQSQSFSQRCKHKPCPHCLRLPEPFPAKRSKHRASKELNNSTIWQSLHRAQDELGLQTALTDMPAWPKRGSCTISSFLPGLRAPCREGRSVMGAWSMPSLPSAKPLASSPRQHDLKHHRAI
ncbi:uncharacterized protein LOC125116818 [Phacochoerus africanus]|uniref:uncharacterized protein LOC125116818 n=1 Tax=Phacochoerus africanus TaxID=41426 RepID=UPI001FDA748D|nr:uncharacterized protein LOC125116818 [Phacochoerus africanus]